MSRILVGHSYFLRFDPKLWRARQPYPPLGTLYAAALLRERGHDVAVFDAMLAASADEWHDLLHRQQPSVAVLFEDNFNYLSKMCLLRMREAAFSMIAAAKAQGCTVIVAGADVTDNGADYLHHGADYAVIGEGEEAVCELIEALERGGGAEEVEGLMFRDESGEVRSTSRRAVIRDLDALPAPAHDLIDLDRYREAWQPRGRFSLNLVTSRGCPFHCNWCAKPIWGQRYNVRSPESIVEEIRRLRELGAEHLWFMDDILGIKPGWLTELAERLEAEDLQTPFKCLSRADLLQRPGEVEALRRAGCEMVWIGAESGSQSVLDAMEKGTTVEQIHASVRRLKEAGIGVAFFLQFGYPGETWEDIEATLQLVRDCDPDDVGMSVSYPLPGTPFFERVRDQMPGRHNWVDSEDMAMLYDGPFPTSFYHHLHSRLHTEFRLQKARRNSSVAAAVSRLLRRGQARPALGLVRDAALLPLQRAQLQVLRRRGHADSAALPIELTRVEAATPSGQESAPPRPKG
ncbi:MAG: radical SAM protein [Dehalococcoidia bacterium]|nr:radical SAM protein [Dehalococcoidia bacterium]